MGIDNQSDTFLAGTHAHVTPVVFPPATKASWRLYNEKTTSSAQSQSFQLYKMVTMETNQYVNKMSNCVADRRAIQQSFAALVPKLRDTAVN